VASMAADAAAFGPLVDTTWLAEHLGDPDVAVVDCRYTLTDPRAGERGWLEGHIPGAAFLSVSSDLSGELREGGTDGGRAPLPEAAEFEAVARRAGIGNATKVVAYDEAGEGGATRLWWLLRHFGHDAAAVLDGALGAWKAAGGELRGGAERPAPGDFTASDGRGDTVSLDEVRSGSQRVLDAREPERFRGEREPLDPVAGHIPGALNVPSQELAPAGRFPDADELRDRLGDGGFVASCGSGITATTLLLAAEIAGVEGRLYPGSWSEWSRRGLPVETGDDQEARQ
jgi:thiosulfate/3-mercaptopyruvate sulfurtransferase